MEENNANQDAEALYNKDLGQEADEYQEYLIIKGLMDRTIKEYMIYYKIFTNKFEMSQQGVRNYLASHNGNVARAFIRSYMQFKGVRDIELPVKTGSKKSRIQNLMPPDEYERLRQVLYKRQYRFGLMLDLTYLCALRRDEVCNIRPNWFMLDNYKLGESCRLKIIGKRNKERIVVVPADIMQRVFRYIESENNKYELGWDDKLFKIGPRWWWEVLTRESERVLRKRYKPHELRHTRSYLWRKEGKTIDQVQKRLGHSSISTTQRYWHIDPEEIAEDWEKDLNEEKEE